MPQIDLKNRLKNCKDYKVDLRLHVLHFKLVSELINEEEVTENLENLKRLNFENLLYYKAQNNNKFVLYFRYTKNVFHKYVIDIRGAEKKIRIVTIHKIHGKFQKRFEQYANK